MRRLGVDGHILTGKHQGSNVWLINVIAHAAKRDPDTVFVVYSFDPGTAGQILNGPNIEHRALPFHAAIPRLLFYWPYAMLVHGLDALLTQYVAPPWALRPQIVVVHDVLFETNPEFFPLIMRWRLRLLVRMSVASAFAVIAPSNYSQDKIASAYRIPESRITVARCGVGEPILGGCLPPGLDPGVRFVLFVGRIEPRKNLTLLLEAFACISDPRARLVVVGHIERSGRPVLSRLAKETRAVHFERVDDKTLWALYRHAAALVFPSLGEGFGLPVLEALAARCSVIVASTTALPEVGGNLAIYFDPLAPDATERLTECIAKALAGLPHVDVAALEIHLKQFAWPGAAEALVQIVSRVPSRT
jgi:glycosyltransferase involved in cell wall biosynthesis